MFVSKHELIQNYFILHKSYIIIMYILKTLKDFTVQMN